MNGKSIARRSLIALFGVAAACSGSSQGAAGQGGNFDADISGAATAQLSGFATSSGQAGVVWSLHLITPGGDNNIVISRGGSGLPGQGTYPLVDYNASNNGSAPPNHLVASVGLSQSVMVGQGFDTLSGTLTISQSSATSVSGSFTMTASLSRDPASTVVVTGTFASINKGT